MKVRLGQATRDHGVGNWITDLTDPTTSEIGTLRLVTDNGPCFTSARFGAWITSKRHIAHIRTRRRAPWTNTHNGGVSGWGRA